MVFRFEIVDEEYIEQLKDKMKTRRAVIAMDPRKIKD